VAVNLRPVYPLAVRVPAFFKRANPQFARYVVLDSSRVANPPGVWDGSVSGWNEGDHLTRAASAAGFDLAAMDAAVSTDPDRYETIIAGNEQDHAASSHWGVPSFVFGNEPLFGQDRIDLPIWRMQSKGQTRRS